ncbi:hypothetical protein APTSU1_001439500 [Apodemus speciosus]|uniref:Uncharacterized protein n=1 Tax=Apodemus speciosus TaxID=105296 RepID=A0ABQ0FIS7_APOSI
MFALSKLPTANFFEEPILKYTQPCLQFLLAKAFKGGAGTSPITAYIILAYATHRQIPQKTFD